MSGTSGVSVDLALTPELPVERPMPLALPVDGRTNLPADSSREAHGMKFNPMR